MHGPLNYWKVGFMEPPTVVDDGSCGGEDAFRMFAIVDLTVAVGTEERGRAGA